MKRMLIVACALFLVVSIVYAAAPKSYQVTGPVLELKDDLIVVQKGNEKWEIAKDKDTKVAGDLKVGSRVTIQYQMRAASIEVKAESKKSESKKK